MGLIIVLLVSSDPLRFEFSLVEPTMNTENIKNTEQKGDILLIAGYLKENVCNPSAFWVKV